MGLKGFAGLFLISIVLAGILTYTYQLRLQSAAATYHDVYVQEIQANKMEEVRTAILMSHMMISANNEIAWRSAVQQNLDSKYGVQIFFDDASVPTKIIVIDPYSGMRSEFYEYS